MAGLVILIRRNIPAVLFILDVRCHRGIMSREREREGKTNNKWHFICLFRRSHTDWWKYQQSYLPTIDQSLSERSPCNVGKEDQRESMVNIPNEFQQINNTYTQIYIYNTIRIFYILTKRNFIFNKKKNYPWFRNTVRSRLHAI